MYIDPQKCNGCSICIPYCPAGAISLVEAPGSKRGRVAVVDQEACLECGNCIHRGVVKCPTSAFSEDPAIWDTARAIRRFFSDPMVKHPVTSVPGRGTEEVKTNDVTGRVKRGEVGIGIEMGRPCLGTSFAEVEKVTRALAPLGIAFEECNPLTHLMDDRTRGTFPPEVKAQRVISAIIEFTAPASLLPDILRVLREVAPTLETVFSLDLISCFEPDGSLPVLSVLRELGIEPRPNAKVNLGMGRPRAVDKEVAAS